MILPGKVFNNTGVEKSNCTGEDQHPVSLLEAAELDHSVAEAATPNVHSFMGGVGRVLHDGHQLVGILCSPTSFKWAN